MLKFLTGLATGVFFAVVFVRYDLALPAIFDLPDKVKKNVVSTAVEGDLYDLANDGPTRGRALAVYFKNRAGDAVKVDAAAGHPFLNALYHARASREARELGGQWTAYDKVLAKPALRATLKAKHGVSDTDALKRAMLWQAYGRKPFLKSWLEQKHGSVSVEALRDLLSDVSRAPDRAVEP
jgi:hypothetical protein